jgi:hypothetical protein
MSLKGAAKSKFGVLCKKPVSSEKEALATRRDRRYVLEVSCDRERALGGFED